MQLLDVGSSEKNSAANFVWRLLLRFALLVILTVVTTDISAKDSVAKEITEMPSALLTVVESAEVSASRAGVLSEVRSREGQLVKAGQLIAELHSAKAAATVKEAELELRIAIQTANDDIDVRYAQKTRQQAESELERSEGINRSLPNTIPEREIEFLRLAVERARLEIERAERTHALDLLRVELQQAAVDKAKLELAEHQFRAPIGGMVVSVEKRVGEWIEPGDVILQIVRIDRIRAEGLLKAELAQMELIGRPAQLLVRAPDGSTIKLRGSVSFVSPEANPVNAMVRVWAEFDCGNSSLRPGLRGAVRISSPSHAKKPHAK